MSGWTKFPHTWTEEEDVEAMAPSVLLFHISALNWSGRNATDGDIPKRALRRLWAVDDIDEATRALLDVGWWEPRGDGFHINTWEDHLMSASEVEERRRASAIRSARSRRHKAGDHSMCDYCEAIKAGWKPPADDGDTPRDASRNTSRAASRAPSVTPLGTERTGTERSEVKGRGGKSAGGAAVEASADAPATPAAPRPTGPAPQFTFVGFEDQEQP